MTGTFVGGMFDRMEYVLAGEAVKQIRIAEPIAVSGETGISPQAFAQIEDTSTGRLVAELPGEYYAGMHIKVRISMVLLTSAAFNLGKCGMTSMRMCYRQHDCVTTKSIIADG
jgi:hypothetical protein